MKKRIVSLVLTLIVWGILYYTALPPINIQSQEFWSFLATAAVAGVLINAWAMVSAFLHAQSKEERVVYFRKFKFVIVIFFLIVGFYGVGSLLSSPILRASAYSKLLQVDNSQFQTDVKEVNYSQIPILDSDSAARLAEREMGSMADMVSQYEVSPYYSQINYQGKPFRVTPLQYGDLVKWFTNRGRGIPAYIQIDMATQDCQLVKLENGIQISPFEHFGRLLDRYLRFRYPTLMFRGTYFEIDDEGTPFWICPVVKHTIGLFGGTDVTGAVLVNAVSGEHQYYDIKDVPRWIDRVYDADLLISQYDFFGSLKNGFFNSVLSQKDCLKSTEGYNYIALNDDVWVYTGITSVGGDESLVGFVLMNQRTKETNYYSVSGAKETSAMRSAEGLVQHLGYQATFPLLLNIGGEPTYFMALKDGAGLVKKYAMVNVQKYQVVAAADSVGECEKAYRGFLATNGIRIEDAPDSQVVQGVIAEMKDVVFEGSTYYYIIIEGSSDLYQIAVGENLDILRKKVGEEIIMQVLPGEEAGIYTVQSIGKKQSQ